MNKAVPEHTLQDRFLDQPYLLAGRLIDPVSGMLSWQGKREHLRRKELEVLALLASAEGRQVSRENFIAVVWEGNDLVGDRGLSSTIGFLRRSLHDQDLDQPLIRTIPRRGYQLAVAVQEPARHEKEQSPAVLTPGGLIPECPDWRLVKRLSESALSDCWLAEPSEFGEKDQGLRVFRFCRSEAQLRRLQREVTLLRYLRDSLAQNQHFAVIRDWQFDEPPYFLSRDYTKFGKMTHWGSLAEHSLDRRVAMMLGLSDAVAAMHALGVVHRQLSADTILVDQSDAGPQLKISAFDLAALSDRSALAPLKITAAGLTLGIDERGNEIAAADDIYALGVLLLQLSVGDLSAQPNSVWLSKIENAQAQTLIARCCGPAALRPSAAELAAEMRRLHAQKTDAYPEAEPDAVIPETAPSELAQAIPSGAAKPGFNLKPMDLPEYIGNYRLLDRLGEGGMGSVYLAEQREPYRKVALKIIRSGLDGKQILSRFEAERQALALMNHPNVTTVLDSGLATDGRPFFAMEYVQGDEITKYCDALDLNLPARIKLFLQVCDGLLHAHQKGVLHRDIKPSNLMVSRAPDSAGTVKIIDFGLAKSLHGKLAAHTLHTSFGAFIGTPVYCSPEHISGSASGVDTRSDIYSMGVVLYELLAGTTPIANESLENLEPEKIREFVCKSKLPSMREQLQNTSAEKRLAIAEHRSIKLDELPKTLEGDLSWVVGKCLERDPNDRYPSVLELKKDLQRWLELRPVEARPTTSWYRFRKLVRRNRVAVAIAAAVTFALLGTTTAAVLGFVQASEIAAQAKKLAEQADLASKFQERQWQSLSPEQLGMRIRTHILTALNKSRASVETTGERAPQLTNELNRLLKEINFTDISISQLREDHFKPALKDIAEQYRKQPLLQARLRDSLADSLRRLGILDLALEAQNQALTSRQTLLGPDHFLTLESTQKRGDIYSELGQDALAAADYQVAASGLQRTMGEDHSSTLLAKYRLLNVSDRSNLRVEQLQQLIAKRDASHGSEDYWALSMRGQLASWDIRSSPDEAQALLRFILDHTTDGTNPETKELRAETLSRLAKLSLEQGNAEEALSYSSQSLDLTSSTKGAAANIGKLDRIGRALIALGRASEAEKLNRDTLYLWQTLYGEDNPWVWWQGAVLADVIAERGRLHEAENMLSTITKQYPAGHQDRWGPLADLGQVLRSQGKLDASEFVLRESQQLVLARFGNPSTQYAGLQADLALVASMKGNHEAAAAMLRSALATFETLDGHESSAVLSASRDLGMVLARMGQIDEAKALLMRALKTKAQWRRPLTLRYLADLLRDTGDLDGAIKLNVEAVAIGQKTMDPHNPELAASLNSLALTQSALGHSAAAKQSMLAAMSIISQADLDGSWYATQVQNGCITIKSNLPRTIELSCDNV